MAMVSIVELPKYETYKDSGFDWLGKIPNRWELISLKHLLHFHTGGTPSSGNQQFYDGELPWITIADLNGRYTNKSHFLSRLGVRQARIPLTPKGSLLYSFKLSIGQVAFASTDVYTNEAIASFLPGHGLNLRYYFYALPIFLENNAATNIYGAKLLNQDLIKNAAILKVSSTDQHLIAKLLDKKTTQIDEAIAIKEQQIALLKERKQIIIQKAVTQGLDPNVPMKDSGVDWIGKIPAHWNLKKLRYLGVTQNGISAGAEYFGEGFPFVSYGDVYKNRQLPELVTGLAKSTLGDQKLYSVLAGDVFFTRTSETVDEIGFASICFKDIEAATFAGFLIRFRPCTGLLIKEFSKYYFNAAILRKYFVKEMNLVIRASLSQELLKNLSVPLPPVSEQFEIYQCLEQKSDQIDEAISIQISQIEKLKEYKTTLINSAVTGKIKVTPEMAGLEYSSQDAVEA